MTITKSKSGDATDSSAFAGSMARCFEEFAERHPELEYKYPDYSTWLLTNDDYPKAFRRGWQSAFEIMKSND